MATTETCFHFLIGLIVTIIMYIGSTWEPKKKEPAYTNSQMCKLISEHVHSERDRKLVTRRLVDKVHYEPLSEEFQLSVRQTKKIVYKYRKLLFAEVENG